MTMAKNDQTTQNDPGKPEKRVSAFRTPERILLGMAAAFALAVLWNVLNNQFGWVDIRPF
jgi:hypothetical protein